LLTIDENTKEITEICQRQKEKLAENRPIALRKVAVRLSRAEEEKRMQDYFDKIGVNN
jgi:hypothetical protein